MVQKGKGGTPGHVITISKTNAPVQARPGMVRIVSHSETAEGTSSLEGQAEGSGMRCTSSAFDDTHGCRVSLYGGEFLSSTLVLDLKVSKKGVILYPFF